MKRTLFAIIVVLFFSFGCSSTIKNYDLNGEKLKLLALDKYGLNYQIEYNSGKSFAVVVSQNRATAENPNPYLSYFVYNLLEASIVFEDNPGSAQIVWKSPNMIEVLITPGTISDEKQNNKYGYTYDVILNKKIKINSSIQSNN
jgi:hypothetical protein